MIVGFRVGVMDSNRVVVSKDDATGKILLIDTQEGKYTMMAR